MEYLHLLGNLQLKFQKYLKYPNAPFLVETLSNAVKIPNRLYKRIKLHEQREREREENQFPIVLIGEATTLRFHFITSGQGSNRPFPPQSSHVSWILNRGSTRFERRESKGGWRLLFNRYELRDKLFRDNPRLIIFPN